MESDLVDSSITDRIWLSRMYPVFETLCLQVGGWLSEHPRFNKHLVSVCVLCKFSGPVMSGS